MLIALQNFQGERPVADARLISGNEAQLARNCKLWSGKLKPWFAPFTVMPVTNPPALSIYGYDNPPYWMHWSGIVNAVRGPIAETTRLYWTGDGAPRFGNLDTIAGRTTVAADVQLSPFGDGTEIFVKDADHFMPGDDISIVLDNGSVHDTEVISISGAMNKLVILDAVPTAVSIGSIVINLETGYPHKSYLLGVPAPGSAPVATPVGGAGDPEDIAARSYVYTFVASTELKDMEGQPSIASTIINAGEGQQVDITNIVDPFSLNDGRPYTKVRIYRTATGNVSTDFLFVAEIDAGVTTYSDTVAGTALGEVLPSTDWEVPPADMRNLIELPNGVLAATRESGNEVLFSEPYQPHAWPTKYRRSVRDEVVAIAAFGSSTIVGTKGRPTLITGTAPDELSEDLIESIHPCVSKQGMVDMGYAVLYPSKIGLVLVTVGLADVITHNLFSPDEWEKLNPSSFIAARYDDRYICFYKNENGDGGFILDPKSPGATLTSLDICATAVWSDPETGDLYMVIQDENGEEVIAAWNDGISATPMQYTWRSKEFVLPIPVMMRVVKVDADAYPVKINLFMDGQLFDSMDVYNENPVRCVDDLGRGRRWEIEIIGDTDVESVYVASSMEELTRYAAGVA